MLPFWKIERELRRLAIKVIDLPQRVGGHHRQAVYDRTVRLNITDGACVKLADTAILLLYPIDGVALSTLEALTHMQKNGVAPVVVSNLPLSKTDREKIAARAHLVIERPNRGYDFGGYRDGVLKILERGALSGNLFILNDSIWFPLSSRCSLIDEARNNQSDLFGIYFNHRDKDPRRSHIQSYFYRFGPRITRSPDFLSFWKNLVVYNSKDLTVRRCEMALTNWFATRNFSIGQKYGVNDFHAAIAALKEEDRAAFVDYLVETGDKHASRALQRLRTGHYASQDAWEADALQGLLGHFLLTSHPSVLFEQLRLPVLKKDRQHIHRVQRRIALEDRFSFHLSETVRQEMAERL